jgi:peptidoglycan/xylan/chitin deacetylase (PgdA/CDA1 family)
LKDFVYRSFARASGDRVLWRLDGSRLRVLGYHGVCDDELAGEPWMPSYFVTASAFEAQLQYLGRHALVLPLSEAAHRLCEGTLPRRAVCLTFDDGYGNNLRVAVPLLRKYSMPATIFLSTAYVETGDWHPFVKLKLLRLKRPDVTLPDYKVTPLDTLLQATSRYWPGVETELTDAQRETLRPMTVSEVQASDPGLIEFGAHSHTHCIARNETSERRREEVRLSVCRVAAWTGRPVRTYSYPNGEPGDFGETEKAVLREEGIAVAVTGIAGANGPSADLLEIRRYPLTLQHDANRFRAEVSGFRSGLLWRVGG